MTQPVIQPAEIHHVEPIVALIESAYRGESGLKGWTTETHLIGGQRTDVEEITALIQRAEIRFFILVDQGVIRGCCMVEHRQDAAYFGMFAVSPLHQSRGYGSLLLAHAEHYAAQILGAKHMVMSVIKQRQELLAWYEQKGYAKTGATLSFPYGNPRAGLPKRDDLVFLVLEKPLSLAL